MQWSETASPVNIDFGGSKGTGDRTRRRAGGETGAGVGRGSKQRETGGAANEAEGEETGRDAEEDADGRAERAAGGEDAGGDAEG